MASQYPAVCSRPPWAPGWCLHCGAPGWKAPQRLPPLCECVQGRTQSTLFGTEERTSGESQRKKEKVNDMYNKLQKSTVHYTIKDWFRLLFWLCISELQLTDFLFRSTEVVVLQCAYSYSKITLHHSFHFDETRGALQRPPPGSFSYYLVCHRQLHMQASHFITKSESSGSFAHQLLYTHMGQLNHLPYFCSLSTSFFISERNLWLRERLKGTESIIYHSKEHSGIRKTINVGAVFHRHKGTNKTTNSVDWASACPRSPCKFVPFLLSLWASEWMSEWIMGTAIHM